MIKKTVKRKGFYKEKSIVEARLFPGKYSRRHRLEGKRHGLPLGGQRRHAESPYVFIVAIGVLLDRR